MYPAKVIRAGGAALVLALALAVTGCGSDNSADSAPPANAPADQQDGDAAKKIIIEGAKGPDGKEERVFGIDEDQVVETVEQTLQSQNAKASWDGTTMRVELDGSTEDITAGIPCSAVEALLKDGEEAVLVYGDGEVRCADR